MGRAALPWLPLEARSSAPPPAAEPARRRRTRRRPRAARRAASPDAPSAPGTPPGRRAAVAGRAGSGSGATIRPVAGAACAERVQPCPERRRSGARPRCAAAPTGGSSPPASVRRRRAARTRFPRSPGRCAGRPSDRRGDRRLASSGGSGRWKDPGARTRADRGSGGDGKGRGGGCRAATRPRDTRRG